MRSYSVQHNNVEIMTFQLHEPVTSESKRDWAHTVVSKLDCRPLITITLSPFEPIVIKEIT